MSEEHWMFNETCFVQTDFINVLISKSRINSRFHEGVHSRNLLIKESFDFHHIGELLPLEHKTLTL